MKCNACLEEKDLSCFHKDKQKKTGYRGTCKSCVRDGKKAVKIIPTELNCTGCDKTKPLDQFTPTRNTLCGYTTPCLDCRNKRQREKADLEDRKRRWKEWSSKNKEYQRERKRKWYHSNPGKAKAQLKRSRAKRPDKIRESNRMYRSRQLMAEGSFTEEEWTRLCEDYGHNCLRCGEDGELSRDHVIPISKGGADYISNIQPLCRPCNSWKKDKDFDFRPYPLKWF